MRNACPSCQTVYAVTPADVGRRIVCTKCDTPLVIDADGFRLLTPPKKLKPIDPKPAPAPADDDDEATVDTGGKPPPPRPRPADEPEPMPARRRGWPKLDLPTVMFTAGVVLVLWFLFMPLIGVAKAKWYAARIEDEQLAHDQEVKRLDEKGQGEVSKKRREEWAKRKEKLETDVQWVGIHNRQSEYWDRYGILGGFVLTAVGSVGLLGPGRPLVTRIVGAVVVCSMLILVFLNFAWRG